MIFLPNQTCKVYTEKLIVREGPCDCYIRFKTKACEARVTGREKGDDAIVHYYIIHNCEYPSPINYSLNKDYGAAHHVECWIG